MIRDTLAHLMRLRPYEVIVSDGASTDGTAGIARSVPGISVVQAQRGRAYQMNAGARYAQGDVLLFLHADTRLPENALSLISGCLERGTLGGRFRTRFDDPAFRYRLIALYTRYPFFSYGDQAFFVLREVFRALGGFDPSVPFEDVDFYRRIRRKGRTKILRASVMTSARRFKKKGFFRQKLINLLLSLLPYLGISPKPLMRRWYPDVR